MKKSFNKLSNIMPNTMANTLKGENKLLATFIINWPEIVGLDVAKNSLPIKLAKKQDGEMILHVEVNSSYVVEFEYQQLSLLDKISLYTGYNAVSGFKIMQKIFEHKDFDEEKKLKKYLNPEKYNPMIDNIEDDNLRNALARLINED